MELTTNNPTENETPAAFDAAGTSNLTEREKQTLRDLLAKMRAPRNAMAEAVAAAGGQRALGDLLGVRQQAVSLWIKQGFAPIDRAIEIEAITGINRTKLIDPRILARVTGAGPARLFADK